MKPKQVLGVQKDKFLEEWAHADRRGLKPYFEWIISLSMLIQRVFLIHTMLVIDTVECVNCSHNQYIQATIFGHRPIGYNYPKHSMYITECMPTWTPESTPM